MCDTPLATGTERLMGCERSGLADRHYGCDECLVCGDSFHWELGMSRHKRLRRGSKASDRVRFPAASFYEVARLIEVEHKLETLAASGTKHFLIQDLAAIE